MQRYLISGGFSPRIVQTVFATVFVQCTMLIWQCKLFARISEFDRIICLLSHHLNLSLVVGPFLMFNFFHIPQIISSIQLKKLCVNIQMKYRWQEGKTSNQKRPIFFRSPLTTKNYQENIECLFNLLWKKITIV